MSLSIGTVTINTQRFMPEFFDRILATDKRDKAITNVLRPIIRTKKQLSEIKKRFEELTKSRVNFGEAKKLYYKIINNLKKGNNQKVIENYKKLKTIIKEIGIEYPKVETLTNLPTLKTSQEINSIMPQVKQLLDLTDPIKQLINFLVKEYNSKTGFPNPVIIEINYKTTPIGYINFWSNLFFEKGKRRKFKIPSIGVDNPNDEVLFDKNKGSIIKITWHTLVKIFGNKIDQATKSIIATEWARREKSKDITEFINQAYEFFKGVLWRQAIWPFATNRPFGKYMSENLLKTMILEVSAESLQKVINEAEFGRVKDLQIIIEKPPLLPKIRQPKKPLKNEVIEPETELNQTEIEQIKKLIQEQLKQKEAKGQTLTIKPIKWSIPGACGLTSTQMILDYLGIKIPKINFKLDNKDQELAFILYKVYENYSYFTELFKQDNNFLEYLRMSREHVKNILYTGNILKPLTKELIIEYTQQWKNLSEIIILLSILVGKKVIIKQMGSPYSNFLTRDVLNEHLKEVKDKKALPPILYLNASHFTIITGLEKDNIVFNDPDGGETRRSSMNTPGQLRMPVVYFLYPKKDINFKTFLDKLKIKPTENNELPV